jgi:hypothetical protein
VTRTGWPAPLRHAGGPTACLHKAVDSAHPSFQAKPGLGHPWRGGGKKILSLCHTSEKKSKSLEFHTFAVWGKEIKAVQKLTCEKRLFVSERIKHIQPQPEADRSPQPYRHGPITTQD